MADYNVIITNGKGTEALKKGTYNVTAVVNGYDTSTLEPKTFNATDIAGSQIFTLVANGTLTFNVNETGLEGGTPVTSGSVVMTDNTGAVEYGTPKEIGTTGDVVFNNVPFGTGDAPYVLYFKQLTTDDNHNIYEQVIEVQMTEENQVAYIKNDLIAEQTFDLNDATYGFPLNGTLNFTPNA